MRFGDGDVYLAAGINDSYQQVSSELSKEMEEAFLMSGEFVYKCLHIHSYQYGYEKEMYLGNHLVKDKFANKILGLTFQYFVGHKIYSHIGLHFAATYSPEIANHFLKALKENCVLFIGNKTVRHETVQLLFGNVPHVKTPSKNAYDCIDEVEKQSLDILNNTKGFGTVVVAMGCSGRPLMKRLFKNKNLNIFLFDFGSLLDGICGDKSRAWLKKEEIDYDVLLKDL